MTSVRASQLRRVFYRRRADQKETGQTQEKVTTKNGKNIAYLCFFIHFGGGLGGEGGRGSGAKGVGCVDNILKGVEGKYGSFLWWRFVEKRKKGGENHVA